MSNTQLAPQRNPVSLDLDTVETLQRELSPEILDILLREFAGGVEARFGQLAGCVSDPSEVSAEAHVLKSEAATFGALALADACHEIELAILNKATPDQLKAEINLARQEATRYIEALNSSTFLNHETI